MEVVAHVINAFQSALREGRPKLLVGICGRAGSGKSTLARTLAQDLRDRGIESVCYAGDWRLSLDSANRKAWIGQSWEAGISAYLSAINQFNWWDFAAIEGDLDRIMAGEPVMLRNAYDRATGERNLLVELPAFDRGVVIFENAILGGVDSLIRLEKILLVNTPDRLCFERTLEKDADRRSIPEIAARYLMTTYSENFFLESLHHFQEKIITCDSSGDLGTYPEVVPCAHIPFARKVLAGLLPAILREGVPKRDVPEVEPMPSQP